MKFRFLAGLLVLISFCFLTSCSSNFSSASNGFLFVAEQGTSSVYSYAIDLSTGGLTAINKPVTVKGTPVAMVIAPNGSALYGVNTDGTVWGVPVNSDGTMGTAVTASSTGLTDVSPLDIVVDHGNKFLFVANQGNPGDITSGSIVVFAISGTGFTQVGVPVSLSLNKPANIQVATNPGPSALAVTADSKFLYVANTFDNSLAAYTIDSNGNLAPIGTFPTSIPNSVGISPSGLAISPDGSFLYLSAFGSNNISGYIICDTNVNTCNDVNNPDGHLTQIATGFPIVAGIGPTRMVTNSSSAGSFLYAIGEQSNQILPYKESGGSGALSALNDLSTGSTPTALATRAGTTVSASTGGTTNYLFVLNSGSASISAFSYDSTTGVLNSGTTTTTATGQPVAIAIK
jgi:6-phosphogluconolactonase (cycloisomerase 2 family)